MENQDLQQTPSEPSKKSDYLLSASLVFSGVLIAGALIYNAGASVNGNTAQNSAVVDESALEEIVLPSDGVEIPVKWNDLGKRLVENGVIDGEKFENIYTERGGGLSEADKKMLYGEGNGNIIINHQNSGFVLNMLWALGLGNKNEVLENGPMVDPQYGGAGNFASTGGWTISNGEAMSHYSKHQFVVLTPEQQALVLEVSKNVYRPCCGNSTYFPDCNHGMAMLGLLELAASQGLSEEELYKIALNVNSYWFPDTYLTIAKYFEKQGVDWDKVDAKQVLGFDFSSAAGYRKIVSQVEPPKSKGGGGCGV